MNENIRVVKKIKMEFFCTGNRSMTIPTVRNVEHGKSFVLIGCGSRNSKRVKSYGRLKNGRKRRTARRSDSTVSAKVFDLRETLERAHTVALDIKDFMDHGGNK